MTNPNLEEIFWKDGRLIDEKNNKIHPQPVGNPIIIVEKDKIKIKDILLNKQKNSKLLVDFNAYTLGQPQIYCQKINYTKIYCVSCQLYKK